jgi:hypothetical protein
MALQNACSDNSKLSFTSEQQHPWLQNIRPDILVNVNGEKYICIEMHYTAFSVSIWDKIGMVSKAD